MHAISARKAVSIGMFAILPSCWCGQGIAASPKKASPRAGIEKLFALGEKSTPSAVAAAKEQYEQLKRNSAKDSRIDYAFVLVLINQHKYREAAPLLSGHLSAKKPDSSMYCVKIWAAVQDRKAITAIDDMVALSRQFPRSAAAQPDAAFLEVASFLGAMFGYLDLVRPEGLDPKVKSQRRNEILANIGNKYLPAFDEGRDMVRDRLAEMQAERNAKQDEVVAAAEKRRDQDESALENARTAFAEQQDTAKSSADNVREAQRELNVIQQQLTTLSQDRTRLSGQIISAQAQLAAIQSTSNLVDERINRSPQNLSLPPIYGGNRINPVGAAMANALALTLASLNKQAYNVDRQMLTLQGRATELMAKGAKESNTVAQSEEVARKASKQAKAIEKKLRRPETATKTRVAMTPKITSLSTYIPFPYEEERERVLSWFAE